MSGIKNNIRQNYLFVALSSINLTHGVWMIFLAMKGFSLVELGLLEGIYHITSFLMEIPTGAVADLWGRKLSRVIGRFISIISYLIMFLSGSFFLQAIGFMITAMSNNLESGAGDALVYDSLIELEETSTYMSVAGKQELTYQGASIFSLLLAGLLAQYSYAFVFIVSIVFSFFAMLSALQLEETTIGKNIRESKTFFSLMREYTIHIFASFSSIKKEKRIFYLMLISEVVFTFITTLFFYLQTYWSEAGHPESYITTIFAINAIITGITALFASKIVQVIGKRWTLSLIVVFPTILIWLIATTPYSPLFYILFGPSEGLLIASVGTYLNELINSKQRATILSMQSMLFSLIMVVTFPSVGFIASKTSIPIAFIALSVMSTLFALFALTYLIPIVSKKENG
ncbi:MAG: MFS transporter [Spirochaetia bacterium]|nr:MFS transporter [Spirochaetia bacterium]